MPLVRPQRPALAPRVVGHTLLAPLLFCAASLHAGGLPRWKTLPALPPVPVPAHSATLAIDGPTLRYAEYGTGAPVILLHGGLGHADHWVMQIPALAARYRVIAPDSRGHGRSARDAAPMSYRRMADDIVALMDHLDLERAHIVGWSDGAIVGLELAVRHAERVASLVAFAANYRTDGIRLDLDEDPVGAEYAERARRDYLALSPAPGDYERFAAAMQAMWRTQPVFDEEALRAIRLPVLVVAGDHEEYVLPEHTRRLAQLIPDTETAILPGTGHFAPWQAPETFTRVLIDFLERHAGPSPAP